MLIHDPNVSRLFSTAPYAGRRIAAAALIGLGIGGNLHGVASAETIHPKPIMGAKFNGLDAPVQRLLTDSGVVYRSHAEIKDGDSNDVATVTEDQQLSITNDGCIRSKQVTTSSHTLSLESAPHIEVYFKRRQDGQDVIKAFPLKQDRQRVLGDGVPQDNVTADIASYGLSPREREQIRQQEQKGDKFYAQAYQGGYATIKGGFSLLRKTPKPQKH